MHFNQCEVSQSSQRHAPTRTFLLTLIKLLTYRIDFSGCRLPWSHHCKQIYSHQEVHLEVVPQCLSVQSENHAILSCYSPSCTKCCHRSGWLRTMHQPIIAAMIWVHRLLPISVICEDLHYEALSQFCTPGTTWRPANRKKLRVHEFEQSSRENTLLRPGDEAAHEEER